MAEEEVEDVAPSPDVERFRAALLRCRPDLADGISPWTPDLDWRQPWGREDLGAYFVSLTLSYSTDAETIHAIEAPADEHTLVVHDPQICEEML